MGDLTTLHKQAVKLKAQIHQKLEELEAVESGARHGDVSALAKDLRSQYAEFQRVSLDLQSVARMFISREPPATRTTWKCKVEQVVADVDHVRLALDKYGSREQRRNAERVEREELFARADLGRRTRADMDAESQMAGSVARTKRVLEEIFETGTGILGNMSSTRDRLKAAQRKALDVVNTLGLGETLLKLIEKRQRMDIMMTYGGMLLMVLIVVLLIWIFWR